jgi:tricorn protease
VGGISRLAGKTVILTVNNRPSLDGSHEALVQTIGSEALLRQHAWVEANRRHVDAESGGRIGYIYVRDTAEDGQSDLYPAIPRAIRQARLIIDERWNSGGQIPDRFVELLGRRVTNYWSVRDGHDWQTPEIAHRGPEGDARQRLERFRRRLLPVAIPQGQTSGRSSASGRGEASSG